MSAAAHEEQRQTLSIEPRLAVFMAGLPLPCAYRYSRRRGSVSVSVTRQPRSVPSIVSAGPMVIVAVVDLGHAAGQREAEAETARSLADAVPGVLALSSR